MVWYNPSYLFSFVEDDNDLKEIWIITSVMQVEGLLYRTGWGAIHRAARQAMSRCIAYFYVSSGEDYFNDNGKS